MKISELISKLEEIMKAEGDMLVFVESELTDNGPTIHQEVSAPRVGVAEVPDFTKTNYPVTKLIGLIIR